MGECNELNMEMNNTLKYNLLCVNLIFNSIYFILSLHDRLARLHRFMCNVELFCRVYLEECWSLSYGAKERLISLERLKKQHKGRRNNVKLPYFAKVVIRMFQLPLKFVPLDFCETIGSDTGELRFLRTVSSDRHYLTIWEGYLNHKSKFGSLEEFCRTT